MGCGTSGEMYDYDESFDLRSGIDGYVVADAADRYLYRNR